MSNGPFLKFDVGEKLRDEFVRRFFERIGNTTSIDDVVSLLVTHLSSMYYEELWPVEPMRALIAKIRNESSSTEFTSSWVVEQRMKELLAQLEKERAKNLNLEARNAELRARIFIAESPTFSLRRHRDGSPPRDIDIHQATPKMDSEKSKAVRKLCFD